jgi:LTXXQ motif family protein
MTTTSWKMIATAASVTVLFACAGGVVFAQQSADPHHPPGSPAIEGHSAPAQPGQIPSGGMMGMGMMGQMPGRMMGMMGSDCPGGIDTSAFTEGRIAFLKAELGITDAQKSAWEAYAAALKKNLEGMQATHQTMMKVMQSKSPVERVDARISMMEGRLSTLKEIKPALATFYNALSDDQKKKADQLLVGMGCMM